MSHTPEDDFDRFGFTRHELLSSSTATAAAPLALASAPQAVFEVTTLRDVVDANDGVLSLREAITLANDNRGLDTITFAPSLFGGTIDLVPRSPLIITDDLVIDGDRLDRGAGGITISGAGSGEAWGRQFGPDSVRWMSPLELRGGRAEIAVSLEDLTIANFEEVSSGIDGEKAAVNFKRAALDWIYSVGIETDGFVSLQDSSISGIGQIDWAAGVISATGISAVDSRIENVGGRYYGLGLRAPKVSVVRSTIDQILGYDATGVRGDDVSMADSSISRVDGTGGGSYGDGEFSAAVTGTKIFIDNSTIAMNRLGSIERPLAAVDGVSVIIRNSTIADNTGPAYGTPGLTYGDGSPVVGSGTFRGTYGVRGDEVTIINSILVGNGADGRSDIAPGTTISSNGHNIFAQLVTSGAEPGDVLGVDSSLVFQIGDLADNGGPTQTIALRNDPTNPALNAADPTDAPPTDQRGFLRDATPDIGAFELDAQPFDRGLVVTTLDDVVLADGEISLREAVLTANDNPGLDTITFADAIRGGTITLTLGNLLVTDDLVIDGDPLNGGAGGIILDGGFGADNGPGAATILDVQNSRLTVEDLTVRNAAVSNMAGENADIVVERASLFGSGQGGGPAGANIDVSGGTLEVRDSYLGRAAGKEGFVSIAVGDGADVVVTGSFLQGAYFLYGSKGIGGNGTVRVEDTTIAGHLGSQGSSSILSGGAGIAINGEVTLDGVTLIGNGVQDASIGEDTGRAVAVVGQLMLSNSTIVDTRVSDTTAAVEVAGGTATIVNTTITGSRIVDSGPDAPVPGSGIRVADGAVLQLANSIVDDAVVGPVDSNGANTFRDLVVSGAAPGDALGVRAEQLFALT